MAPPFSLALVRQSSSSVASARLSVKNPEFISEKYLDPSASRTCWLQLQFWMASWSSFRVSLPWSFSCFHMRLNSRADVPGRCRALTSMPSMTFRWSWFMATLKFWDGVKAWILS